MQIVSLGITAGTEYGAGDKIIDDTLELQENMKVVCRNGGKKTFFSLLINHHRFLTKNKELI
ncbi:MAG: hypothetical protein GDA46_03635 [Bdellovibrionales bacterium]|nr:hypothetical protein [Bdellovibrionales bacterium]